MSETDRDSAEPRSPIPADDPYRMLTIADPENPQLRHVSIAGGTYTILVSGAETAGRLCLVDMLVPDGGGPPLHRHDFEETFTMLEGELTFTFRGDEITVRAGTSVNVPANAPHAFKNTSGKTVHMLCLCAPAGQDEFFLAVGAPLAGRSASPPGLGPDEQAARAKLTRQLAPRYRTEMV